MSDPLHDDSQHQDWAGGHPTWLERLRAYHASREKLDEMMLERVSEALMKDDVLADAHYHDWKRRLDAGEVQFGEDGSRDERRPE